MAAGDAVAADVPGRYDVVINGKGYMLLKTLEPSIPFRTHRATYTNSPTFVERQNVGSAYGDNAQDFFLTLSQKDWSLGEAQRYYRADDQDRVRRYWTGSNIDPVQIPGQITLRTTVGSLTFGEAVRAVAEVNVSTAGVYAVGTASLAFTTANGSISNKGAHGLGAAPSQWGLASDGSNAYISTTTGGTVGIRKYDGASFSTFSASGADSLAYLNNSLYGYQESTAQLLRWSTAGAATNIFTWKDASGNALTGSSYKTRLRAYGGVLYILRTTGVRGRGELWQYDGTNTSQLAEFPANFVAQDMEIGNAVVYVAGFYSRNTDYLPAIQYYVNSTIGELWRANVAGYTSQTWPAMAAYGSGLAFTDDTTGKLLQYNLALGGVQAMGSYTVTNATPMMAASRDILLHTRNATSAYYFPTTTVNSSGFVTTSLVDFENSLTKTFRGIKVDFSAGSDGDGGSVDIAYQTDSVDGSFTSLKTGATSGTEYTPNVSGHSISAKVTLNKGTSTSGPVVKRIYFRAAPILQSYRQREYILDLSGTDTGKDTVKLADGLPHPLPGFTQAQNLQTAITGTTTFTVTDGFGSFTGLAEPALCEIYNTNEGWDTPETPGCYVAKMVVREV